MSSIKSIVGRKSATTLFYLFRIFPIKNNKIFVKNFFGKGFGDSPKYVISFLLQKYKDYDIVWVVNDNYTFPDGIRTVCCNGIWGFILSIYEQVTAKVWIDNCRKYSYERKRKKQFYIQTWHGDIGIKKAAGDALKNMHPDEVLSAQQDSKMADLFVCGNEWMCQRYREAYWYDGEIAICGLPRRDILYTLTEQEKNRIKESLGIPQDTHLLLYVPTFRNENLFNNSIGNYIISFDWKVVLKALENRFGGVWLGLMRLHPNAIRYSNSLDLPESVFNVTSYPDVTELYCISDCCISDYSSSLFEFAVTKKKGFIYAPDKKLYEGERGYYFPDNQLPFTIAIDIDSLVENINAFDEATYLRRHKMFYQDTIHMYPEGHASGYLVNRIVEVCN